ncbi:MAG: 1-acyl-sn-glycerol-3-phosphate acyltransferase, partial [Nanoarchaeota archaeon]|nr:1-acyl-sn-glycerol-3-phosphate acyltransferase [Nanoarchaeota archaeon]MBU1703976.1 1-acyl-sn-glycerol-3-phosphate acyltransferase [Nanoarchaeota archaeon]
MKKEVLQNRLIFSLVKKFLFPRFLKLVKELKGAENIPRKGPFIIAANHVSYIDPPLLYSIFGEKREYKVHFLASIGIKWMWWIFGGQNFLRWAIGMIPTPERRGKKVKKPTIDYAVDVLKKG